METVRDPGFAPSETNDGRELGHWQTRYTDQACRTAIRLEAIYLGALITGAVIILFVVALEIPQQWLPLTSKAQVIMNQWGCAWVAGILGGSIHSIKWLYHTVAHNIWNIDRRLWRVFTPPISGAFGFVAIVTIASGLFTAFNPNAVESLPFVIAVGFITGYFSDGFAAKLADIGTSLFGNTKKNEKQ